MQLEVQEIKKEGNVIKKKLVLINPMDCYTPEFTMPNTIPTQLLILATYLKKKINIDIEILDLSHKFELKNREKEIQRYLDLYKNWTYFGITCFTSNYYIDTVFLAKKIREVNPDAVIFVGGYHPTMKPNDFIFLNSPFDFIFVGEAEIKLTKLMSERIIRVNRRSDPRIIYCNPLEITDFINTDWSFAESFDFIKNPDPNNLVMFPVFLSRGCPFTCKFCCDPSNPRMKAYREWRRMPIDKGLKELTNINERFQNRENLNYEIMICDPLFGTPKYRIELYKKLLEYAPNQNYWAELRVDTFKPKKEIPDLKKLKFHLSFGLESGSPEMLKIMDKTEEPEIFLEKMQDIATQLDENQIYCVLNILIGHPGETHKTLNRTHDYLKKLLNSKSYLIPSFSKYMLYPGSEIYSQMDKYENLYETEFLIKEWWKNEMNQMRISQLVNPSNELSCIDVYYEMQKIVLDLLKLLRQREIGRRTDMIYIQRKYKQHIMMDKFFWRNAPQLFINFIRDHIQILLGDGYSEEIYNFIKKNMHFFLKEGCPQEFLDFINQNFPKFL